MQTWWMPYRREGIVAFLKFGCLGLVGIFLLLVVIGLAAGGSKPDTTITGQPAATVAKAQSSAPQPTEKPSVAIAKVGQRIESAGVAITVNSVEKKPELNQFMRAKTGSTYVVADVTVENANREKAPYNPLYFKVKDADGYEYTGSLIGDDKGLKSGELASEEKARGTVAFEVPSDAKGLSLSYQPIVIFGGYQVLRVALE